MISNTIVSPLLKWYDENKRILPWRESRDSYRVWISEIMLQQTRVEAVKPYYDRFMKVLPDVESLASVSEDQLMKLWEGLGYYNRARNLQKAAKIIMECYEGKMPSAYEEILKLPGIGSYTAGAVASISFGKRRPAVDGNVLRILTRLTGDFSDVLDPKYKKQMEEALLEILPEDRPGDFNQAMMELGATVCLPNGVPKCDGCPWKEQCIARKDGLIEQIPYKKPKKMRQIEERTVLVIRSGERTVIHKRGSQGILAGLYEFPSYEGYLSEENIKEQVRSIGLEPLYVQKLEEAKHIFSHKEWHMKGYLVRVSDLDFESNMPSFQAGEDYQMLLPIEIERSFPIPSAYRSYTKYIEIALGNEHFQRNKDK